MGEVLDRLRGLFQAPVFGDEEHSRVARSVNVVAWGLIAGLLISSFHNWVAARPNSVAALLAGVASMAFVIRQNRRGRPRQAALLTAITLPLTALVLTVTGGFGFRDVAMMIFPAGVVVSGLLLDRRSLVLVTSVVVLCIGAVVVLEKQGVFTTPFKNWLYYRNLIDAEIIVIMTAVAVGLLMHHLNESLARIQRNRTELAAANVELADQASQLRRSEERYRTLLELAADAIVVGDAEGRVTEANRQACEITGYTLEELTGQSLTFLFSSQELKRVPLRYDLLQAGATVVAERLLTRKDGSTVPVEMASRRMPLGTYQAIVRDVRERKRAESEQARLEEQLRQAQKMESLGRLAGGVAHDFNNLLTAIGGSLELAQQEATPGSRADRWIREGQTAAERAATLTRQLLAFGRKQPIEPAVIDLRMVVEAMRPMLARLIGGTSSFARPHPTVSAW
jgi:PAS domain S-box-containing protein